MQLRKLVCSKRTHDMVKENSCPEKHPVKLSVTGSVSYRVRGRKDRLEKVWSPRCAGSPSNPLKSLGRQSGIPGKAGSVGERSGLPKSHAFFADCRAVESDRGSLGDRTVPLHVNLGEP